LKCETFKGLYLLIGKSYRDESGIIGCGKFGAIRKCKETVTTTSYIQRKTGKSVLTEEMDDFC